MLTSAAYTPDQDSHVYKSDVTDEVTGTGYTAGGQALAGKTVTYDAGTNQLRLDADDVSWTGSTITARYAIVYKDTGSAGTSPLLGYFDFGGNESTTSAAFSLSWDPTGLLRLTAS